MWAQGLPRKCEVYGGMWNRGWSFSFEPPPQGKGVGRLVTAKQLRTIGLGLTTDFHSPQNGSIQS